MHLLYVGSSKKIKIDSSKCLRISLGAAQGLEYLHHDCNPLIIHRDVKTSNILLDDNFEAHLSYFGIAKCIHSTKTHTSTYVMGGKIHYFFSDYDFLENSRFSRTLEVISNACIMLSLPTIEENRNQGEKGSMAAL